MIYYPTTQTVQADGVIYSVIRRQRAKDGTRVIAQRGIMWIYGVFRSDGTPVGGVVRDYMSPNVPCCIEARWEGKKCDHMGVEAES